MISKLEEKFFQTFNIKPILDCKRCGASRVALGLCADTNCDVVYPLITDSILLKLICICFKYDHLYKGQYSDVSQIKNHVLYHLINIYKTLTDEPWLLPHVILPRSSVRTLMVEIEQVFRLQE